VQVHGRKPLFRILTVAIAYSYPTHICTSITIPLLSCCTMEFSIFNCYLITFFIISFIRTPYILILKRRKKKIRKKISNYSILVRDEPNIYIYKREVISLKLLTQLLHCVCGTHNCVRIIGELFFYI